MLSERVTPDRLNEILITREDFRPYPRPADRDFWDDLPESVRASHIERGLKALGFEWPAINAWLFLDFVRTGRQAHDISIWGIRRTTLCDLVIAECIENKGRFLDDITNGVWAICEESYWGVTPHLAVQKAGPGLPDVSEPTVDLFAAETSALLAWIEYLIGPALDTISPLIRRRIEIEIQRRILTPLHERDDFFWMGYGITRKASDGKAAKRRVNNWNPWICSNWLITTLLIEKDPGRRTESVLKMLRTVDHFIDPYPKDGGCDEGPGYWGRAGASLFECLDWLDLATDGNINVYDDPLIAEIGKFIYRTHIDERYFVNFADAPPILLPSSALTYVYGKRIQDPEMIAFGAWAARKQGVCNTGFLESIGRQLRALFHVDDLLKVEPAAPLARDVWLPDIQVAVGRDKEGANDGLYFAAKGGHNEESHNHNDVGSFIVFTGGKPLIVDAGVETYTRKTFSAERYDIWTMQSAYHSLLPTIDGFQQSPGPQFEAAEVTYRKDGAGAAFSLDISKAYPAEAGMKSWQRIIQLERKKHIMVSDTYQFDKAPTQMVATLLTPCEVDLEADGRVRFQERNFHEDKTSGSGTLEYDPATVRVSIETMTIDDPRLKGTWGDLLYRIVFEFVQPGSSGSVTYRIS